MRHIWCHGMNLSPIFSSYLQPSQLLFWRWSSQGSRDSSKGELFCAKGCFGLAHQTLAPQGWHSLLQQTGLGTAPAFERLDKGEDCPPASAHSCDSGSLQLVVEMDMCLLPHQTESLSSAQAEYFIYLFKFCGFMAWTRLSRRKKSQNEWWV